MSQFPFIGLTGEGDEPTNKALDGLSYQLLGIDDPVAYGVWDGKFLTYYYDKDNDNTLNPEDPPLVIKPNDNETGFGAWILAEMVSSKLIVPELVGPLKFSSYGAGVATLDADGNLTSVKKNYGSQYVKSGAINLDFSTVGQGTFIKVTGLTAGILNNVTINSDAFRVGQVGDYRVFWKIDAAGAGTNKIYEVGIFVNDVEQGDGYGGRKYATSDLGSQSGGGLIEVTDTDHDIDLRVMEPGGGGGTDLDITHLNFFIRREGPN